MLEGEYMILQRKANDKINSIVDVLWYVDKSELDESKRNDIIIPSGHIHIVYNFEDPYYLVENNQQQLIPDTVLVGQFKKAVHIKYGNRVKQLGLAIRPSALFELYNQFSGLYTGAIIDCSLIDSMKTLHQTIIDSVKSNPDNANKVLDEIEHFFEQYHYEDKNTIFYEKMITYLEENRGIVDIKKMADTFGYSVSSLERNFKKHLGLSPKAYADILRFRYAIIEDDPKQLFYDQSHFIKNCRKYTNKIPADLSKSDEISLLHMLDLSLE